MRRCAALALIVFPLAGCVSVVRPPEAPADPATVFVAFESMHKGLLLPEEDGSWTEWGYGEWDWYALDETAWYDVIPTLLWPTRGALGRRELGRLTAKEVPAHRPSARVVAIEVPGDRLRALRDRLQTEWRDEAASLYENPAYGMSYVHSPRPYWFGHTCDDAAAEWLEALGCDVDWLPVRMGLTIEKRAAP